MVWMRIYVLGRDLAPSGTTPRVVKIKVEMVVKNILEPQNCTCLKGSHYDMIFLFGLPNMLVQN